MPITEPTALLGNMSDASVNTVVEKAWCSAMPQAMTSTATQACEVKAAKITTGMQAAMTAPVVFLARLTE